MQYNVVFVNLKEKLNLELLAAEAPVQVVYATTVGAGKRLFLKPHGSMCIASVIESPFFAVVQRIMQKIFSCEIIKTVKLKQGVPHCKNVSCRQLCLCIPSELSCPINITISSE